MDRSKQREIASKGGKAAHQKGTAHEWTSEEAREAGRKGGMASHRRKQGEGGQSMSMEGGAGAMNFGADLDQGDRMVARDTSESSGPPSSDEDMNR